MIKIGNRWIETEAEWTLRIAKNIGSVPRFCYWRKLIGRDQFGNDQYIFYDRFISHPQTLGRRGTKVSIFCAKQGFKAFMRKAQTMKGGN